MEAECVFHLHSADVMQTTRFWTLLSENLSRKQQENNK